MAIVSLTVMKLRHHLELTLEEWELFIILKRYRDVFSNCIVLVNYRDYLYKNYLK